MELLNVYLATAKGVRWVKNIAEHRGLTFGVSPAEERKQRGRALDSILHELLLTELELAVHLTVGSRGDLSLPMTERRYYRQEKRLTFSHQGKTRDVIPDAGFLLAVHPAGEEGTSQNARPSMLLHFVEMDNGTMSLKRVLAKLRNYDLWSRSEEGRAYLRQLYRAHGAKNPRPNFRLLIVCHDKAGLHSGGDARRELDVFAQCLELPKQMRERVWLTTVERLRRHQDEDPPLAAPLWLRVRDARAWLADYKAYTANLPRGRGQKRYHRQRQFVEERLAELPLHTFFPRSPESSA